MLTPQEVSGRAFSKAAFGGYNMAMVDEFLDELTDDYTSLYKENAALKAKLKVLVDKVEEYRATEDSMRAALLTAQRMANTMVEEAEEKKKAVLAGAEDEARAKIGALQSDVELEQRRLNAAKAARGDRGRRKGRAEDRGRRERHRGKDPCIFLPRGGGGRARKDAGDRSGRGAERAEGRGAQGRAARAGRQPVCRNGQPCHPSG